MSGEERKAVIEKALGDNWNKLDAIIKLHYGLKPGSDDQLQLRGTMNEVYHSKIGKLFLIPGRIFGALVPYKGLGIPTEVKNWTSRGNHHAMYWHRRLFFPDKDPVIFRSTHSSHPQLGNPWRRRDHRKGGIGAGAVCRF